MLDTWPRDFPSRGKHGGAHVEYPFGLGWMAILSSSKLLGAKGFVFGEFGKKKGGGREEGFRERMIWREV